MSRVPSDKSLLKMMSSTSAKKKRDNYSYSDIGEEFTRIETGVISQAKDVF